MQTPDEQPQPCDLVGQTCRQFERDFGLVPVGEPPNSYQRLREKIADAIGNLLTADPKRLVYLMYRLDVNEGKFNQALELATRESVIEQLAELVLERVKQKVYWRNRYKS